MDSACRFQYPWKVGPVATGRSATPQSTLNGSPAEWSGEITGLMSPSERMGQCEPSQSSACFMC